MKLTGLDLTLEHATINPEKAGGEEKGETGCALSFSGDVLIDKLTGIGDYISSLSEFLYGEGHELIAKDVTTIEMKLRLEKVSLSVKGVVSDVERLKFSGARINEISLTPKHGRAVGLKLKAYVHPADDEWNEIVAIAKTGVTLSVWGGSRIEDKPKTEKEATRQLALDVPKEPNGEAPAAEGGTTSVAPTEAVTH